MTRHELASTRDALAYIEAQGFGSAEQSEHGDDPETREILRVLAGCLSKSEIARRYGCTPRAIEKRVRKRKFPQPVRLALGGVSRVWWPLKRLRDWEQRKFGRTFDAPRELVDDQTPSNAGSGIDG